MKRYGMRFRTIKYWQGQAVDLWRFNGLYAGVATLAGSRDIATIAARDIGHAAIQFAAVVRPSKVRSALDGTL